MGDTLKPTIDAGCAIRAGNGMTRERSAGRATTTLEQHAPPVREPQRVQWHPRRRLERRRPGPARACVPSRVRIRAPGASRLDQVRRAAERRVQPTVSQRAATITPPSARPTARPGFDVPQLLIRDDLRTHAWPPHRLRDRGRLGGRAAAQPTLRSA